MISMFSKFLVSELADQTLGDVSIRWINTVTEWEVAAGLKPGSRKHFPDGELAWNGVVQTSEVFLDVVVDHLYDLDVVRYRQWKKIVLRGISGDVVEKRRVVPGH